MVARRTILIGLQLRALSELLESFFNCKLNFKFLPR